MLSFFVLYFLPFSFFLNVLLTTRSFFDFFIFILLNLFFIFLIVAEMVVVVIVFVDVVVSIAVSLHATFFGLFASSLPDLRIYETFYTR